LSGAAPLPLPFTRKNWVACVRSIAWISSGGTSQRLELLEKDRPAGFGRRELRLRLPTLVRRELGLLEKLLELLDRPLDFDEQFHDVAAPRHSLTSREGSLPGGDRKLRGQVDV
jgi:hypothetical protein